MRRSDMRIVMMMVYLATYFFHDDCPIPRKEIEMLSISLSKMKKKKTPFFTISRSKIEFQSLNYKNYMTIHCIKSTLDQLDFPHYHNHRDLTHFTSTQAKQENTIMSRTKKNSGSLRCILYIVSASMICTIFFYPSEAWEHTSY